MAFVAVFLFVTLAKKKVAAAPHVQRANGINQLLEQCLVAANQAAFKQVCDDTQVSGRFLPALCQGAYTMADFQPQIP